MFQHPDLCNIYCSISLGNYNPQASLCHSQFVCLKLRASWSLVSEIECTAPSTPACCPHSAPVPGSLR